LLLSVLIWLTYIFPLILIVFFSPIVGLILHAYILDLDKKLPDALHSPHHGARRVNVFLSVVIIVFLPAIGTEVWIRDPELRTDGLNGMLAPQALGF